MKAYSQSLANAHATEQLGEHLGACLVSPVIIYFKGDLGAGKTTMIKGILRGLGYHDHVKSPSFTIVEPYTTNAFDVYHMDFYRIQDPEELLLLGLEDYVAGDALCLIEWPENANQLLPMPDIAITINFEKEGRHVVLKATTEKGEAMMACLEQKG